MGEDDDVKKTPTPSHPIFATPKPSVPVSPPRMPSPPPPRPSQPGCWISNVELQTLRADQAYARRVRQILERFATLPGALRKIAELIEEMLRG